MIAPLQRALAKGRAKDNTINKILRIDYGHDNIW